MKRPFFTSLLLIVLLGALAGTGRTAAASSVQTTHWTRCVLHLDYATATEVVSKQCTRYAMPKETRKPIGHTLISNVRRSPHVIERIWWPTFPQVCSINPAVGPNVTRWAPTICAVSRQTGISSRILGAIIFVESSGFSCVTSTDGYGSIGLMQLIPTTAASVMHVSVSYAATELCIPYWNITAGATYLRQLLAYWGGNMTAAIASYNGGPGNPQYGYAYKVLSYA